MNLYKTRRGFAEGGQFFDDPGSRLFRSVQTQKNNYQGLWIVSPEGKVLAAFERLPNGNFPDSAKSWIQAVLDALDEGLRAFGPVKPRAAKWTEPFPFSRGAGVKPDGGVCLALLSRSLFGKEKKAAGFPAFDSILLDGKDWATLAPPKAVAGTQWTVPESVFRKFCRIASPMWDVYIKPEHVKLAELDAVVESINGGQARIRLTGKLDSAYIHPANNTEKKTTYCWATVEGIALYDLKKKTLSSLIMLCEGGFSGVALRCTEYDKYQPLGTVVEWSLTAPQRTWDRP